MFVLRRQRSVDHLFAAFETVPLVRDEATIDDARMDRDSQGNEVGDNAANHNRRHQKQKWEPDVFFPENATRLIYNTKSQKLYLRTVFRFEG